MLDYKKVLLIVIAFWNVMVFFLYGYDKKLAKMKKRRISEKSLLVCATIVGGFGALLGMNIFHHKTKHTKFKILVPLTVILTGFIIFLLV